MQREQDGEFLGLYTADSRRTQYRTDIRGDLLPVTLHLLLNVQFQDREPVTDGQGIRGCGVEQISAQIEGVRQTMRWVNAHHQRAVTKLGKPYARGSCQAGLPHAALTTEEENPHVVIVERGNAVTGLPHLARLYKSPRNCPSQSRSTSATERKAFRHRGWPLLSGKRGEKDDVFPRAHIGRPPYGLSAIIVTLSCAIVATLSLHYGQEAAATIW